jgi:hypothetical protein
VLAEWHKWLASERPSSNPSNTHTHTHTHTHTNLTLLNMNYLGEFIKFVIHFEMHKRKTLTKDRRREKYLIKHD